MMLMRREFTVRPNVVRFIVPTIVFVAMFVLSFVAWRAPIIVTDPRTEFERSFLHSFGEVGVMAFGAMILALGSIVFKARKATGVPLILDDKGLQYGGIKIPWPLMREAVVCNVLGKRHIGIRTVNDRAIANKINEELSKRLPLAMLFGLRFQQWRTQCSVLIPAAQEASAEEVVSAIEQHRMASTAPEVAEAVADA